MLSSQQGSLASFPDESLVNAMNTNPFANISFKNRLADPKKNFGARRTRKIQTTLHDNRKTPSDGII